jgi:hypothetical protein
MGHDPFRSKQCFGGIMSHRGARVGQGRQGNGVTTSLSASPHAVPAALKPTHLVSCAANVPRTNKCSPSGSVNSSTLALGRRHT